MNLSSTHLQRFLAARRRELDALTQFRATVSPLTDAAASPTPVAEVRQPDELAVAAPSDHQAIARPSNAATLPDVPDPGMR